MTDLQSVDQLAVGDAIVVVDSRPPHSLLLQLLAERPRAFEWNVLEAGPRWRVQIVKRAPVTRSVGECLETDHRRLDRILIEIDRLVEAGDLAGAAVRFADFRCGLDRHICAEEQVLFPFFEERTGLRLGPTRVMRLEHVEIRRAMAAIVVALDAGSRAPFADASTRLVEILARHNAKEEMVLYPTCDRLAQDPVVREALVREMILL